MYLNRAVWLGKGERLSVAVIEPMVIESVQEPVKIDPPPPEPAAQIEEQHQEPIAEPSATPAVEEIAEEKTNLTAKEENALALPLLPPAVEPEKVFSLAVEPDAGSEEAAAPYPPTPAARKTGRCSMCRLRSTAKRSSSTRATAAIARAHWKRI